MKYNDNGTWRDVQVKVANAIKNEYGESNNDGYSQNYLNDKLVNVGTEVDSRNRVNFLKSKNLFDKNKIIPNYRIASDGTDFFDVNYSLSLPIKVKTNTKYTISGTSTNVYGCYAFYQNDGTFISRSSFFTSSTTTFTTPANATYIRIADLTTILGSIQLEEGDTASSYVTYSPPSIFVDETEIYNKDKIEQYSYGEIEIGTWIDGKPLYRKVIKTTMPTVSTDGTYVSKQVSIGSSISYCYVAKAIMEISGQYYTLPYLNNAERIAKCFADLSSINLVANGTAFSNGSVIVVVEYTKTTDTVSTRNLQTRNTPENDDEGEIVRGEEE